MKIEEKHLLHHLENWNRIDSQGGYPAEVDAASVPGYWIVFDIDHNGAPAGAVYTEEQIARWLKDANEILEGEQEAEEEEFAIGEPTWGADYEGSSLVWDFLADAEPRRSESKEQKN